MVCETATGLVHEVGLHEGDDGLVSLVVPFAEAGLAAGEPVALALGRRRAELVRAALPDSPDVTFLTSRYIRPASAVAAVLESLTAHVASSPARMRVVGELDVSSLSAATWGPWARYEAAVNHLYAPFPVTAMCVYDTAVTPADVITDLMATHSRVATPDGSSRTNGRYQDPVEFLRSRPTVPDPLENTPPVVELVDPDPAAARRAVRSLAARSSVANDDVADLVVGVSEVVANAWLHGRPPVITRMWTTADRLVVTVSDAGEGPVEPFAGLTQLDDDIGGRGLWIAHQLCAQVDHADTGDGFTVRLTARAAHP